MKLIYAPIGNMHNTLYIWRTSVEYKDAHLESLFGIRWIIGNIYADFK